MLGLYEHPPGTDSAIVFLFRLINVPIIGYKCLLNALNVKVNAGRGRIIGEQRLFSGEWMKSGNGNGEERAGGHGGRYIRRE